MTDAEAREAFWAAVYDPDPASMEIAQDLCLERGWKIWELGHRFMFFPSGSSGVEVAEDRSDVPMVRWVIETKLVAGVAKLVARIFYRYRGERWTTEISNYRNHERSELVSSASEKAWYALGVMKEAEAEDKDAGQVAYILSSERGAMRIPMELNPTRKNPSDKASFWKAVHDADPSSIDVAQDVALEHGWKLTDLGEEGAKKDQDPWTIEPSATTASVGAFYYTGKSGMNGCTWLVSRVEKRGEGTFYRVTLRYEYEDHVWTERIGGGHSEPLYNTLSQARGRAVEEAWHALIVMKDGQADDSGLEQIKYDIRNSFNARTPAELTANPTRKNPDDLDAARDKYKEFHRYDPKSEGEFPSSFKIPERLLHAGKAKWITYRSSKVDPSTLKKPKRPVDYIHEHDAGVETYIKDPHPDTAVPETFRDVGALVKLGDCLGFCVMGCDGEEVEAEATTPLPELYSTPDGKCLFVIQGKRDVLAASWGGALGVFARGIDG